MTDWSKVVEVCISGVIGVFAVMFFLQIITQLSIKVIDRLEERVKRAEPTKAEVAVKEGESNHA